MRDENPDPPTDAHADDPAVPVVNATGGKSCLLLATFVAGLVIIGVFLAIRHIANLKKDLPPDVTRVIFDEAWDRWEANAPANYAIEIDVVGPRTATYAVEVRDHVVTTATHNGEPLPAVARTMRTWSVPGMFDTMEHDVMRIEQPDNFDLKMRAEFDSKLGLPRRYYRYDQKNHFDMRWTVTKFEVGPGETAETKQDNAEDAG